MNRTRIAGAAVVAGLALVAALAAVVATGDPASAQTRRFFPFHVNASDANNAALQVNQGSTGNIFNLQDGGSNVTTVANGGNWTIATGDLTVSAGDLTLTAGDLDFTAGDLTVGNGTPDVTQDGEDGYIEGTFEVDGASRFDGAVDLNAAITSADGLEHRFLPTYATQAFTYTGSSGGTVTLFTVGASEEWVVHNLLIEVTTNFDCTGDDCTVDIGDGNDADGFCVLTDAELQTADTEGTGFAAGWQCQVAATIGAYLDPNGLFVYDGTDTIDAVIGEASGTTLSAGAATAHIWYTRID